MWIKSYTKFKEFAQWLTLIELGWLLYFIEYIVELILIIKIDLFDNNFLFGG